jgi:hypothetical protein
MEHPAGPLTFDVQPPAPRRPDRVLVLLANGCLAGSFLLMPALREPTPEL